MALLLMALFLTVTDKLKHIGHSASDIKPRAICQLFLQPHSKAREQFLHRSS